MAKNGARWATLWLKGRIHIRGVHMNKTVIIAICPIAPLGCWSLVHRCFVGRCQQALALATHVLGSRTLAVLWLYKPAIGLAHQVPCSILTTRAGYERVSTLLGRIEHCVYI
ncbi:antitoxin Xre/MbcA/ParS toxin-binding domain-containing protein [Pseudomonas sp. K1(2024)]|uniref:Antitoxin Xre/MbcA/ParS toxin-binding domain-containing protein n=2 Tax=Pseudomonas boreofloridensis TaxID=3064348 RepID=A0ABV4Z2S2_9PSED